MREHTPQLSIITDQSCDNVRLESGRCGGRDSMLRTILLVVIILLLIGGLPTWPYSQGWGYYPTYGLGTVLLIVIILILLGRI